MIDPTPFDHVAELVLCQSGDAIDVWDEYVITLDMLSAGNAWTFAFWRSDVARTSWSVIKQKVKLGDDIALSIDGACQLTGRVESIRTEASRQQGATVILSGRDLAGTAMDFDADPTLNLRDVQLGTALPQIFAELGVPVRVTDSAANVRVTSGRVRGVRGTNTAAARTVVVDRGHANPGEKVWGFAQSIISRLGYLCWIAPDADRGIALVVDVPVSEGEPTYLFLRREVASYAGAYDGNILSGGETITSRGVPTVVNVYTGSDRGAQVSARSAVSTTNTFLADRTLTRGLALEPFPAQPIHKRSVRARTRQRAQQEASRDILDAMRAFRVCEYTVRGHGQTLDGQRLLYALNTIARVRDDVCVDADGAPLDEDMLITGIEFRRSRQGGTTTRLRMVPLGALVISPTEA